MVGETHADSLPEQPLPRLPDKDSYQSILERCSNHSLALPYFRVTQERKSFTVKARLHTLEDWIGIALDYAVAPREELH